jgi:hypothetical protein
MNYHNTISYGDAPDGSEGGYDAHGNYIIPAAMMEIIELRDRDKSWATEMDNATKRLLEVGQRVHEKDTQIGRLNIALVDCRADNRTCMEYLQAVRDIMGGMHFPDMIQRIRNLVAEVEKQDAEIERLKSRNTRLAGRIGCGCGGDYGLCNECAAALAGEEEKR